MVETAAVLSIIGIVMNTTSFMLDFGRFLRAPTGPEASKYAALATIDLAGIFLAAMGMPTIGPWTGGAVSIVVSVTEASVIQAGSAIIVSIGRIVYTMSSNAPAESSVSASDGSGSSSSPGDTRELTKEEIRKLVKVIQRDGIRSVEELKAPGGKGAGKLHLVRTADGSINVKYRLESGVGDPTGYTIGDL